MPATPAAGAANCADFSRFGFQQLRAVRAASRPVTTSIEGSDRAARPRPVLPVQRPLRGRTLSNSPPAPLRALAFQRGSGPLPPRPHPRRLPGSPGHHQATGTLATPRPRLLPSRHRAVRAKPCSAPLRRFVGARSAPHGQGRQRHRGAAALAAFGEGRKKFNATLAVSRLSGENRGRSLPRGDPWRLTSKKLPPAVTLWPPAPWRRSLRSS